MPGHQCAADETHLVSATVTVTDPLHVVGPRAPDSGAWRWDLDIGEIWWSPELYRIAGVTMEFAPTLQSVAALLGPETEDTLLYRAETKAASGLYWITRPDGDRRLLQVQGWPVAGHTPRKLFGTCWDVTAASTRSADQIALRAQHDAILRAARDGICGLAADGRIEFVNPAFEKLVLREGEHLAGRLLHDVLHRDASGSERHALSDCPYGSPAPSGSAVDAAFHRGDGTCIEVGYEQVAGGIVSFRDITARRAAARLLQASLRQVQALSAQRGVLLDDLAAAEERERLRIAAEIHDDTIQALGAVALRLSNAGERVPGDAERDAFADAEIEVRGVAERLRRLMFELMPPDEGQDLRAALHTYCSVLFTSSLMTYELLGDTGEVPADRCLIAYRLVQEVVRNALKHSRGSRVRIELTRASAELIVLVSDDGVGMGHRAVAPTHAGLRIVRKRAEAAGATALFGPGLDGRGSSIELRLPLVEGTGT